MPRMISIRAATSLLIAACIGATGLSTRADPAVPPPLFADAARKQKLLQALPRIEGMLAERARERHIPGLAYAIVIDGEIVASGSLGLRDVKAGAAVDPDTVFRIASMSKSFTALAILKLRDAGKLSLDDPASRHVPEMRNWKLPTADSRPVTIRDLLGHTAGLPTDDPQGDYTLDTTQEAFSDWLTRGAAFSTATGHGFEYSNLGYMILGQVVSNVAGLPFQEYIAREFLRPLGMRSTWWSPGAVPAARLARGYAWTKDGWIEEPLAPDGTGAAMGGLLSSAPDVARWAAMMLSAYPPRDDAEQAPAARNTLREMQAGLGHPMPALLRTPPDARLFTHAQSYGFGLNSIRDCEWGREVSHSGGLPGFGSNMRWLPDHGIAVIVLTNLTYAPAGRLTHEALALLHDTGALQSRRAVPSPYLREMAEAATDFILESDDTRIRAAAADNLFRNLSLEERKSSIAALREELRQCQSGELRADDALRGTLRIDCEGGSLDVALSLTPELPPRIQVLEVSAVVTPEQSNAALCEP